MSLRDPGTALFWWIFLSRNKSWISVCIFYESWCDWSSPTVRQKKRIFNFVLTHLINSDLSGAILKFYPASATPLRLHHVITTTALFALNSSAIYCTSLPFYTSQTTVAQIWVMVLDYHEVFIAIYYFPQEGNCGQRCFLRQQSCLSVVCWLFVIYRLSTGSAFFLWFQVKSGRDKNTDTKNENWRKKFVF